MSLALFDELQPSGGTIQSSATLRNNYNALFQGDNYPLRVVAQETQDNTVKVYTSKMGGYYQQIWLTPTQPLDFAEGNSPAISEPTSNNRISLLTINSAGTLAWTYGTQAASPVAPNCPINVLPLIYVYQRVNKTVIYDYADDNSIDCYIYKDIRPKIKVGGEGNVIGAASSTTDNIVTFADSSGKALKDSAKSFDNIVQTAGNQTVAGIKTFTSIPVLPASDPTTANQATRKAYIDNNFIGNYVPDTFKLILEVSSDGEKSTTNSLYDQLKRIVLPRSGQLYVYFEMKSSSVSYNQYARIYGGAGGTPIGTERRTTSVTYVAFEEIITLVALDTTYKYTMLELQAKTVGSGTVYIKNFRAYTYNPSQPFILMA